jgi:hypothetical protein
MIISNSWSFNSSICFSRFTTVFYEPSFIFLSYPVTSSSNFRRKLIIESL